MKFSRHSHNGLTNFKLFMHTHESGIEFSDNPWAILDMDNNLSSLLKRHKMLDFTNAELFAAEMLTKKNALWRKSQSSRNYCREQASLISVYADDAIERIASQIIPPQEFENTEYGLPTWIRRLTLAFVQEIGVTI